MLRLEDMQYGLWGFWGCSWLHNSATPTDLKGQHHQNTSWHRKEPGLMQGAVQLADSCICGSPQFHIIRFNAAKYELPSEAAMGGHKK